MSVTLAGLAAGSDLVHAARWSQAVSEAVFLPAEYVDAFALAGTAAVD